MTHAYTYDDADELTNPEGTTLDYDENGNQTDNGDDTFEWDHLNRLVEAVVGAATTGWRACEARRFER